jgi:ubiquinone biosynthesis monooxygenase Coq7
MNFPDTLIYEFDKGLRALFALPSSIRPTPGAALEEADLTPDERRHAAALMRINHVGEICAQALYQGQAITARNPDIRASLEAAAREETEHLAWTAERIRELGGRRSLLNPFWYMGALAIGMFAGKCGDAANLGFLAETERQVEAHLAGHLDSPAALPEQDRRSRAIVEQMKSDEARHAETATRLGGAPLPAPVKALMRCAARIMTRTAYRL